MNFKKNIKSFLSVIRPVHKTIANISYSEPNNRLSGKNIIVTGGGRGLGAAIAEKFVKEGAHVLIAGRNEENLQITSCRIGCQYLTLDVTDVDSFEMFIEKAESKIGQINALVNNAGISLHEPTFFDVTPETFDKQITVNMKGGYFLTQKMIKKWTANNIKGNILFLHGL